MKGEWVAVKLMWVTRDRKGYRGLRLWKVKPVRGNYYWKTEYSRDDSFDIDDNLFPYLKWEDEPLEVELWSKELWGRTIDDIIHLFITKQESGEYGCVNDIINSITKEICCI